MASTLDTGSARLLLRIAAADGPIGARELADSLDRQDIRWSESTIARRLRELDACGLTRKVGLKGRIPTAAGRDAAAAYRRGDLAAERFREASVIRTTGDVLNLLRARRAIEPEAVRGATLSLTARAGDALQAVVDQHRRAVGAGRVPRDLAMAFHREISGLTPNPLVRAMLGIVLSDEMDAVEAVLDVVLEARHSSAASVDEHAAIVAAMRTGDAAVAADIMRAHLDRLVAEVSSFRGGRSCRLLERMLDGRAGS